MNTRKQTGLTINVWTDKKTKSRMQQIKLEATSYLYFIATCPPNTLVHFFHC